MKRLWPLNLFAVTLLAFASVVAPPGNPSTSPAESVAVTKSDPILLGV